MTKLSQYLQERSIRQADFAVAIGLSQATVSRLAAGSLSPSLSVAVKIARETDGAVPVDSWVDAPESALPQNPATTHGQGEGNEVANG